MSQPAKGALIIFLIALAIVTVAMLSGCSSVQAYNRTVSAREDGIRVNADSQGRYGGEYVHRVEYRAFK